jgi:hypothetical protein
LVFPDDFYVVGLLQIAVQDEQGDTAVGGIVRRGGVEVRDWVHAFDFVG